MKRTIDKPAAIQAFEQVLESHTQELGQFFLARLLGLDIAYEGDFCNITFDVKDFMFNPQGNLHGGITALVMDVSMGHLLSHLQGPGATLELKAQYLRAVRGGRVRVQGSVIKRGASIWFLQSSFYDSEGELAAFATSTWKLARPKGSSPQAA
jgi:uncharacterized protein (TIGR00369 family)